VEKDIAKGSFFHLVPFASAPEQLGVLLLVKDRIVEVNEEQPAKHRQEVNVTMVKNGLPIYGNTTTKDGHFYQLDLLLLVSS
jgi:hypothetical protein